MLLLGGLALPLLALAPVTGGLSLAPVLALGLYSLLPFAREAWRIAVVERRLSVLHLLFAYMIALWLGGWVVAAAVGVVFAGVAHKLQLLTQLVVRHNLSDLLESPPERVWVIHDGVEFEIAFEALAKGDILVLGAGQTVPVDGTIVAGMASIDQHRLTGESQPATKGVGDGVSAATLVLTGRIQVRVERTGRDTTAARIAAVLEQTVEQQEVRIADQFARLEQARTPMLIGGAIGWLLGGPATAIALLGCNYLGMLIPLRLLTLLNALDAAIDHGILVKDGRALERLAQVDTVIFDKTGTLTLEQPRVAQVHTLPGDDEARVLGLAAAAEQRQTHPIAQAILAAAAERGLVLPRIDAADYRPGHGLEACIDGRRLRVGSARYLTADGLLMPSGLAAAETAAHARGDGLVFVAEDERVIGAVELAAAVRPEAAATIARLKARGLQCWIISGDHAAPTRHLAEALDLDGWFADTLPEQKADHVRALQAEGRRVCFIGDGINDAIALRQADASVSLRGATTMATDAAQVVLMDHGLGQLDRLWDLAQGFTRSLEVNERSAKAFSLTAALGVVAVPLRFKFWLVEIGWFAQSLTGIGIATRRLDRRTSKVAGIEAKTARADRIGQTNCASGAGAQSASALEQAVQLARQPSDPQGDNRGEPTA